MARHRLVASGNRIPAPVVWSPLVRGRLRSTGLMALALSSPGLLAGCGGQRQDAHEPSGSFEVSVLRASFPASQALARQVPMTIRVRNDGTRTIPDLAVTVNAFTTRSQQPGLADPTRPVWIVDQGPTGAETAYTNTWALGSLGPGQVSTFVWYVTPVVPGMHTVSYRVAAGLNGKARAELTGGGGAPAGSFTVNVAGAPPQSRVDPNTGRVIASPPFPHAGTNASPGYSSGSGYSTSGNYQGANPQQPSGQQPGSGTGAQPDQGAGSASGR